MSRTSHHREQKANQCKDLWGRRGDMGTGSHYSKYNRTLASRKDRRIAKSITPIKCLIEIDSLFHDILRIETIDESEEELNLSILIHNNQLPT